MKQSIALCLLLTTAAQPVFAASLLVTPDNLATVLDAGNIDVAREAENVHKAKLNIETARGNLIPSLNFNISAVIANPPQFLVNSVTCLVPFLFPGKWYDFGAAKKNASAETAALEITRLNTYASAYALLIQYSGDQQILTLLNEQHKRLEEYVKGLQAQYDLGLISQADLLRGDLDLSRSKGDLQRILEASGAERANLRKMFGVNIEQAFDVQFEKETPSVLEEARATQALVLELYRRAPERRQLDLLIEGAKDSVHSAEWAWLAGCSGGQGSFGPTSTSAFTQSTSVSISIGYGIFPAVGIAKSNVRELELRESELALELARILETAQASIQIMKDRLVEAQHQAEISEALLFEQTHLVELGKATVRDVLESFSAVAKAKADLLSSQNALDAHRITLKRLGLEGRFLKVLINNRKAFEIKK